MLYRLFLPPNRQQQSLLKSFSATFLLLLLLLISSAALAQTRTVTGRVVGTDNQPLAGVSVTVKGTNVGTTSDAGGNYSLQAATGATLTFSSVGYTPQEVVVGETGTANVTMTTGGGTSLNEVVVIGYQSVRRRDLTGAVGLVNTAAANRNVANTLAESIQGLTPGVTVRNSGAPGAGAKIDIRGAGTFAGNNPLYIIDGMYSDATPDFNPLDVESIQILKDASAAAIYGSRAANGVIIITTKRGKDGPLAIGANVRYGVQNLHKRWDMMNVNEYRDLATRLYQAGNQAVPTALTTDFDPAINTDWQEEFLRQGSIADFNVQLSGGSRNANFFISGSHFRNMGPVIDNHFERSTLRLNTTAGRGRFRFGQNVLLSYTKDDPIAASGVGVNPFVDMIAMPPVIPLRGPRYVGLENPEGYGLGLNNAYISTLAANVPALQRLEQNEQYNFKIRGNAFAEFRILEGLRYTFNVGAETSFDRFRGFRRPGTVRQGTPSPNNNLATAAQNRANFLSFLYEHTLNYDKAFGRHRIGAVVGSSNQTFRYEIMTGESRGFTPDANGNYNFTNLNLGRDQITTSRTDLWNIIGILGRVNYSYDDKYITSITFRRDGSSLFGEGGKWANFPSVSVAWRISRERFFDINQISELKLRASYGSLGNSEFLRPWNYLGIINPFPRAVFGVTEAEQLGAINTRLANANLTWERKKTANVGLDAALLNNRLLITADYFVTNTEDVLVNLPIALTTGNAGGAPPVNAASLRNRGFELALTYRGTAGRDFRWDATLNFTRIRNRVVDFGDPTVMFSQLGDTRTMEGRSIGEWYVMKTDGIFQSQAEIDAYRNKNGQLIQPTARPGDIRYVDVDGDGVINRGRDRYFAGSPWADFESGLQWNASYKGFSVNMQWYGVYGNTLYNRPRFTVDRMDQNTNFRRGATFWTPQTPSSEWPRAAIGASDPGLQLNTVPDSDRWLESGSYLRLRNLEFAYTLNNNLLRRAGFSSTRFFVSGQNLLTFTGYSGLDPDIVGVNIFERGLDNGQYPALRIFMAGVSFGF